MNPGLGLTRLQVPDDLPGNRSIRTGSPPHRPLPPVACAQPGNDRIMIALSAPRTVCWQVSAALTSSFPDCAVKGAAHRRARPRKDHQARPGNGHTAHDGFETHHRGAQSAHRRSRSAPCHQRQRRPSRGIRSDHHPVASPVRPTRWSDQTGIPASGRRPLRGMMTDLSVVPGRLSCCRMRRNAEADP